MACATATESWSEACNVDGDAKIAINIPSGFRIRALGYVMKARGQAIF